MERERLEEVKRQNEERQKMYIKHITDQFIVSFADQPPASLINEENDPKEQLLVEWICKIHKPYMGKQILSLEMSVGLKRTYVVRKTKDFLKAINTQSQYEFTKIFTYNPSEHDFSEVDKEIIQLLQDSVKYGEIYQEIQSPYYRTTSASDDRAITISPLVADELLEKLEKKSVRLENGSHAFNRVAVHHHHHELPFTLQLDKGTHDEYQLDLSELLFSEHLELYGYLVQENNFYKLSPSQQMYIKEVKKLVNKTSSPLLPIDNDQIESFLSHVVPKMNQIGKLKIADQVSSRISKLPWQAKVYVDSEGIPPEAAYCKGEFLQPRQRLTSFFKMK